MKFNESYLPKLGKSPRVTALLTGIGDEIAESARATAPVKTGAYRDSIHVEVKGAANRNVVLVVAADPKAMLIESKTGNLVRALNRVKRG